MKRFNFISLTMMAAGLIGFMGCSDSNTSLERRIANLENRVAQLEEKTNAMSANGQMNTQRQTASVPANNTSPASNSNAGAGSSTSGSPAFNFNKETHDFGSITAGEVVEHTFKFTNTGNAPLVISSASASCGCTVPSWPKDPIAPGKSGRIQVRFDSKNKSGIQNKTVTIKANTNPATKRLRIKSEVVSGNAGTAGPVRNN